MRFTSAVLFFFLLGICLPAGAAEKSALGALEKFDGHSRLGRMSHARNVLKLVNAIQAGLPLLKPSEAEWIAKEKAEIDKLLSSDGGAFDRWGRLHYLSPEYQHQQLEGVLLNMKEALECVLDNKTMLRREMFCWAVVSLHASNGKGWERWIEVSKDSGRLSLGGLGAKPPEPSIIASIIGELGQDIQREIIIPYLGGDEFSK